MTTQPEEADPIIRELTDQLKESENECNTLKRKLEYALSKNEVLKKKYQLTKEDVKGNYTHFINRYSLLGYSSIYTCLLSVLHDDLLAIVFSFLEPVSACITLSRVCKSWKRLLSYSKVLWLSWYFNYNFLSATCTDAKEQRRRQQRPQPPITDYQQTFLGIIRSEERWKCGNPSSTTTVKSAHLRAINCMYHDGDFLYTAGSSGQYVKKWDPDTLECIECYSIPAYKPIFCELELCENQVAVVNDVVRGKMSVSCICCMF